MRVKRPAFTIIELLFIVVVVSIDIILIGSGIQRVRDARARENRQVVQQAEQAISPVPAANSPTSGAWRR